MAVDVRSQFEEEPSAIHPDRVKRSPRLRAAFGRLAPLAVLIALLAALGSFAPSFLSLYSLRVLAGESSAILLLAIGQTLVILLGGIDLSMGALASLASVLIAIALPKAGALGLLGVLALTMLIGAGQGFVNAKAQIASFVVTLAGLGLWSGAALTIAHTTIPVSEGYEAVGWLKGRIFGVPNAFAFSVATLLALAAALRWLPFGRHVYAIGLGEVTAILSGIHVARVKVLAYALSGLFAGLTGMLMVARTYSGNPTIADSLLLPSIAAVVVGGTAITGGYGSLQRTLVGALTIAVLRVGIAVVGLDPAYEPIAYGVLVAGGVALTIDRSKTGIVK
jgi:ribose transport system permease protein